ncbi:MAG: hypothetical protein AAGG56_03850 [Pseudomonadota bacterium]
MNIYASHPSVFEGHFSNLELTDADLLSAIGEFIDFQSGIVSPSLRVFRGGQREELEYRLLQSRPDAFPDMESWFFRIFGNEGTAIFLNQLERWSVPVSNFVAELSAELSLDRVMDVEAVLLAGDYGFTPFGAHKDDDDTQIVHIPISGSVKTMYAWADEVFINATGGEQRCYSPEHLVGLAERFCYGVGDCFHLPPGHFHVGYNEKFSATLVLTFTPKIISKPTDAIEPYLNCCYGNDWRSNRLASKKYFPEVIGDLERFNFLLRNSKAGLKSKLSVPANPLSFDPDKPYSLVQPFSIFYEAFDDLLIFMRGHVVRISSEMPQAHMREICCIFELFNSGWTGCARELELVLRSLHREAIQGVLEMLFRHHVIE